MAVRAATLSKTKLTFSQTSSCLYCAPCPGGASALAPVLVGPAEHYNSNKKASRLKKDRLPQGSRVQGLRLELIKPVPEGNLSSCNPQDLRKP